MKLRGTAELGDASMWVCHSEWPILRNIWSVGDLRGDVCHPAKPPKCVQLVNLPSLSIHAGHWQTLSYTHLQLMNWICLHFNLFYFNWCIFASPYSTSSPRSWGRTHIYAQLNHTMPKHTSSNRARAKKVYGTARSHWSSKLNFWSPTCFGMVQIA